MPSGTDSVRDFTDGNLIRNKRSVRWTVAPIEVADREIRPKVETKPEAETKLKAETKPKTTAKAPVKTEAKAENKPAVKTTEMK